MRNVLRMTVHHCKCAEGGGRRAEGGGRRAEGAAQLEQGTPRERGGGVEEPVTRSVTS